MRPSHLYPGRTGHLYPRTGQQPGKKPESPSAQRDQASSSTSSSNHTPRPSSRHSSPKIASSSTNGHNSVPSAEPSSKGGKSPQIYDERRRGSLQPQKRKNSLRPDDSGLESVAERPHGKGRTHSSPTIQTPPAGSGEAAASTVSRSDGNKLPSDSPVNGRAPLDDALAQDEDEVAGVVGAVKLYQPFQSSEVSSQAIPEINIAVIGAEGVGKSTFVQKAFDLPTQPPSQAAEKKVPIDGSVYLVRLLELPIEEVDIDDDDNTISWPETIEDKVMPKVDGALTLYNVKDKSSLESIPEMLNAINKAALPSVLISCKCDATPEERQVDPQVIENSAKRSVKDLSTLQTSSSLPDVQKQGVVMLLRTIISKTPPGEPPTRTPSAIRRRAQSSATRPMSPRSRSGLGHARASSEYTGTISKDRSHARHDSSLAGGYAMSDRLTVPRQNNAPEDAQGSSWFEESASDASHGSRRSSVSEGMVRSGSTLDLQTLADKGGTLDELVDRLLAQPSSKADNKFATIFLALYRMFAAPGMLLETIVQRFDALGRDEGAQATRSGDQLRYLAVVAQWINLYPGDFAYPKTKRRMRTFLGKISLQREFAAATKEINAGLDLAQEDDDTNWAYCDKDREVTDYLRVSISSTASTLIDDPSFLFKEFSIEGPTFGDDKNENANIDSPHSTSVASSSSTRTLVNVETARQQAQLLQPIPRQFLTKLQWRLLMDFPDEAIAKEMTKIDWTMFSSIRPRDLVRQVSLTNKEQSKCPYKNQIHVNRMIEHFNQLAFWVANYILLRDKPKHRALMVEKIMRIARRLRQLNNYNALGALIAGIKSTPVHRLAATSELISPVVGKDWLKLEILMSPTRSHAAYRLAWENSPGERIPYLPLLRRDLVSAEQGNRTFISDGEGEQGKGTEGQRRINWRKFEIMGEVVVSMTRALETPYVDLGGSGNVSQSIKELILDVKLSRDEDELFERSKQVEHSPTSNVGTSTKIKEFFKR